MSSAGAHLETGRGRIKGGALYPMRWIAQPILGGERPIRKESLATSYRLHDAMEWDGVISSHWLPPDTCCRSLLSYVYNGRSTSVCWALCCAYGNIPCPQVHDTCGTSVSDGPHHPRPGLPFLILTSASSNVLPRGIFSLIYVSHMNLTSWFDVCPKVDFLIRRSDGKSGIQSL